jgi:hypothetical protein
MTQEGLVNFTGGKEGVVTQVVMDEKGNITKSLLFSTNDLGMLIRPKVCKQVSANKTVVYGWKDKKENKFGYLTIN